jgi:hypothetical protein
LEEILRQLHFRYELGFKPDALDSKRHRLRVELADLGKNRRKKVRLRYRSAYVAIPRGIAQSVPALGEGEEATSGTGVADQPNGNPK